MIGAQTEVETQEMLIDKYMSLPNQVWDSVISQASASVDILKDPEVIKQLGNILKTNVRGCKSLGHPYVKQVSYLLLLFQAFESNFLLYQKFAENFACKYRRTMQLNSQSFKFINCEKADIFTSKSVTFGG